MAPKKTTTTITAKSETEHMETDTQLTPMPMTGRPYILESAEFNAFLHSKRQLAAREIEDIDTELNRLQAELEARLDRRKDLMDIVIRAEAALSMAPSPTPSPKLVEKSNDQ